jgi:ClpP class serine protease
MAMLDEARAYANAGVSGDVIKSEGSPLKGAGIPGTSLTPEQRANFQSQVDYLYNRFSGAVKTSRKRVADEALKGSTFYGSEAKRVGLIDSVASLETAIRDAAAMAKIR